MFRGGLNCEAVYSLLLKSTKRECFAAVSGNASGLRFACQGEVKTIAMGIIAFYAEYLERNSANGIYIAPLLIIRRASV